MLCNIDASPIYPCPYRERLFAVFFGIYFGLSLCIQGTHCWDLAHCFFDRFIPVHTGNTNIERYCQSIDAVYPCAYREHIGLID